MYKTYLALIIVLLITIACVSSTPAVPTLDVNKMSTSAVKTAWAQITQTAQAAPTSTSIPTRTALPTYTQGPTLTPAPTNTPAPTIDTMRANKGNGFYLVNVDIAPGVWRSNGSSDGCYWAVTSSTGNILNNHFGMSGGTAYIDPAGFQVEFNGCGTWEFLSPP